MGKKTSELLKKINTFAVINTALIILAFIKPEVALILSTILLTFLTLLFCLGKWVDRRLEKKLQTSDYFKDNAGDNATTDADGVVLIKNIFKTFFHGFDNERSPDKEKEESYPEPWIQAIFVVFFSIIYALAFWKWLGRALLLSIPSFVISIVIVYTGFFGQNTVIFLYTISIYLFLRLYITFALNQLTDNIKGKMFLKFLRILMELARIAVIAVNVTRRDYLTTFQIHSSINDGIIATLVLDSMLIGIKSFFTEVKR